MIYQLNRNSRNTTLIWSLIFCVSMIGLMTNYWLKAADPRPIVLIEVALIPLLVLFAIKRFLTVVVFDFYTKTITTTSVIPIFKNTYSFDRVEKVHIVEITRGMAAKINGITAGNFCIKLSGSISPKIYTIKTSVEFETAVQIIEKWNEFSAVTPA